MPLFHPDHKRRYENDERAYAVLELAYTTVDVAAALLFIVGSVMFFSENWVTLGTWCFLIGSICFGLKPTIRIYREIRYFSSGDYDDILGKKGGK